MGPNVPADKTRNTTIEYSYYEPIKGNQPVHWSQEVRESRFCSKECNGVKLVQQACLRDSTNEVVDDMLCFGKPQTISPKFVPCNTHCKFT